MEQHKDMTVASSTAVEQKLRQNRNLGVSICRVLGMIMIVVCHIGTAIENALLASFFQVGVQLFLFISGYLYSRKKIGDPVDWLTKRFVRINIPVYIFLAFMIAISLFMNLQVPALICLLDIINMEGYQHVLTFLPEASSIAGTGHLWYLTALTLCYLATIFVKKVVGDQNLEKYCVSTLLVSLIVISALGLAGIRLDYLWVYFVGYVWGIKKLSAKPRLYLSISLAMVIAVALRFALKSYCDIHGDTFLYTCVVIPLAYNAIAVWLFATIDLLSKKLSGFIKNGESRPLRVLMHLDALSFCIYLTHYPLIDGPVSLMNLTSNPLLNALALTVAIYLTGWALLKVSNFAIEKISALLWAKSA